MGVFLGADLGGTKLLVGECDAQGAVKNSRSYPTGPMKQWQAAEFIKKSIADYLQKRVEKADILGLGVGVVGRVDSILGVWRQIDIDRDEDVNLAEIMNDAFGLTCKIDNDVRAATRAELKFGVGKNYKNFLYINIGTGIAAGVVINGEILTGSHFNGGEVGHTTVGVACGIQCVCGRYDCVELIASGGGIANRAKLLAGNFPDIYDICDFDKFDVRYVFENYETNRLCNQLANDAADGAARLVMNLTRVTDPEAVVLGGGVVSDGILYELIKKRLDPHTMRFVSGGTNLTELDADKAGLIGACSLVM